MARAITERVGIEANRRVSKLRKKMIHATPQVCIERAYLLTGSYKETEGEPPVIRRAKALGKILKEMTICIEDGELIVGRATSKLRGGPLLPELQYPLTEMDLLLK